MASDKQTEKVGISVRGGSIDVYDMTDNVLVHVIDHDNKDVYIVERDKEGKIRSRAAGKYCDDVVKVGELILCDHCHKPTILVTDGEKCELCNSWVCNGCVDWACMSKANTEAIICKKCSQMFGNCKEEINNLHSGKPEYKEADVEE